jgi:hypothetical protein
MVAPAGLRFVSGLLVNLNVSAKACGADSPERTTAAATIAVRTLTLLIVISSL